MKNRYTLFLALLACGTSLYAQDPGAAAGATGTVTGTYKGAAITYTTVRAKDGWVWLQQNVGSASVAASATDAAGYGDLSPCHCRGCRMASRVLDAGDQAQTARLFVSH